MKKFTIITLILLAILVSACNYPGNGEGQPAEEANDPMATEIARILTGTPVEIEEEPTAEETTAPEPTEEETAVPEETEEVETETVEPEETEETEAEPTQTEEEETPTVTPTNTPTTAPTEPLEDTDPVLTLGEPDWVNAMSNGDGWPTGFSEYSTIVFEDGYLKLSADTEFDGWRLTWPFLGDSYLEVKLQSPECEGNDHFGVMFRVPANANANKGYLFGITCDGKYNLRRWDGQTMISLVDWTASDAINTEENAINKLGVMAEGENLLLYINGQEIKEITNDVYLEGTFGIFVGGTNVEDLTVWVDEIRYWIIP